jgi:hypothetical protein
MPSTDPRDYPNFGLNFSLGDLATALETMHELSTEKQAEYVDDVCKANVNEPFLIDELRALVVPKNEQDIDGLRIMSEEVAGYNATSIGNLAYVVLNCKDPVAIKNAKMRLKLFRLLNPVIRVLSKKSDTEISDLIESGNVPNELTDLIKIPDDKESKP